MPSPRFASLLERFVPWASSEPAVRSALIVGSQARSEAPADEWSDLDLVIFTTDPSRLLESSNWVNEFGRPLLTFVEPTAVGGFRERRVLYSDGSDVDFSVVPAEGLRWVTRFPEVAKVLRRGYVVLVDKEGSWPTVTGLLAPGPSRPEELPDSDAFRELASDFLYHLLWTAKKLRRGETWTAKFGCDGYLKFQVLKLLEWWVGADSGGSVDTWHAGRFVDRWAPKELLGRLPETFARYDPVDIARAANVTADLFGDLGRRLCAKLGFSYPEEEETAVRALVSATLSGLTER